MLGKVLASIILCSISIVLLLESSVRIFWPQMLVFRNLPAEVDPSIRFDLIQKDAFFHKVERLMTLDTESLKKKYPSFEMDPHTYSVSSDRFAQDYLDGDTRSGFRSDQVLEIVSKNAVNGNVYFKHRARIDESGQRILKRSHPGHRHIFVFGGSSTFGIGLEDFQSLPYRLSEETTYDVSNFSDVGGGPSNVLLKLRSPNLFSKIQNRDGVAVYFMPHNYFIRSLCTIDWVFAGGGDCYPILNRDTLANEGRFSSNRFRYYTGMLFWSSHLFRYLDWTIPSSYKDEDFEFVARILKESERQYKAITSEKNRFIVAIMPLFNHLRYSDKFQKTYPLAPFFRENEISYIDYSNINMDYLFETPAYIAGDWHPSAAYHDFFAKRIIADIADKFGLEIEGGSTKRKAPVR
jgi:hypothetical protein